MTTLPGRVTHPLCSHCGLRPRRTARQRYCLDCHAAYTRSWRQTHPLTEEQRRRSNARAYLHVYIRRGQIQKEPCRVCGTQTNLEAHHPDYSNPLAVEWFCRRHRLDHQAHGNRGTGAL